MPLVEEFLSDTGEKLIIEAIQNAEKLTSGEIRVHLENRTDLPCYERAKEVFLLLHMDETVEKNGVLFYVAVENKEFAILGDKGIDEVVPDDFWDSIKNNICNEFAKGNRIEGLISGIKEAGEKLQQYFPSVDPDKNELSNEVSRG